jgi:hypothetical protein
MTEFMNLLKKIVGLETTDGFNESIAKINRTNKYCIDEIEDFKKVVVHEKRRAIRNMRIKLDKECEDNLKKYRKKLLDRCNIKFQKFIDGFKLKSKRRFTNLIWSKRNRISHINNNLMISIWTNKNLLMMINNSESNSFYLPCNVTEHILGFLSLSYIWFLFLKKLDKKGRKMFNDYFRCNYISNLAISGIRPRQFVLSV